MLRRDAQQTKNREEAIINSADHKVAKKQLGVQ